MRSMETLKALWKSHRLGLLYGALWALAPIIILNPTPLFNYYDGPENFRRYPMQWDVCFVMVIASMLSGVAVTALFRRFLKGRSALSLFLWSPLSLLIGATLYGFLYAQLLLGVLEPNEPWGQLTLGCVILHPVFALFSYYAFVLVPAAALNTWHLWRRVNRSAD